MNDSQQLTDVGELMLLVDMSCIDVISCFCLSSSRGVRCITCICGKMDLR